MCALVSIDVNSIIFVKWWLKYWYLGFASGAGDGDGDGEDLPPVYTLLCFYMTPYLPRWSGMLAPTPRVRSGRRPPTGIHITWAAEVLSIVFVCLCVSGFISLLLLSLLNNNVAAQRRMLPDNDAIMGEFTLFLNKTILLLPTSTLPGDVASNNVWWLGHRCPGWCKHTRARGLPLNNGNGAPARKFQFSTDEGPDKMFIEIKIFWKMIHC